MLDKTSKHTTYSRRRRPDACDVEVGRRVRSRRLEKKMSQSDLASKCGVTFQQIQKNEKGVNRVSASRLQQISAALEVPVSFFFDNAPQSSEPRQAESIFTLMQTSGSVRIVKALAHIKSRKARDLLVRMAEEMASVA